MADSVTTQVQQPPDFLIPYYKALAERGMNLGNLGFTAYDQDRVAPWNEQMDAAGEMIQTRALVGSPLNDQASDWWQNTMSGGNNINNAASGGQVQGATATMGPGSIRGAGQSQAQNNPYYGSNPYLNNAINQAQNDVTGRIDSKFNNNAFGGTAHQQTLSRELGNVSNQMRMQDYTQQQQLGENAVNRNLSNQQYNINNANDVSKFNAGLGFQNANIANQNSQFNSGVSGQNVQNQNQLNQFNAGLQNQNRQFQAGAMGFLPQLANADYNDANQLMNLGIGLQGHNQSIADANYNEFIRQQNYPSQQLSWMQGGLNPMSQAFSNQTLTGPKQSSGSNPWATAAGVAGTVGGIWNMFGG